MKIKMVAIAPYDGWAFIIKDEKLFLIRPPYHSSKISSVEERVLENAIHKYGFQECNYEFNDLSEIAHFLNERYKETLKQLKITIPDKVQFKKLLEYATEEVLLGYIERVKQELIPQRNFDAADSVLFALQPLKRVRQSDVLSQKLNELLRLCVSERNKLEELVKKSAKDLDKYSGLKSFFSLDEIADYMNFTQSMHQIIPMFN